MNSTDPFNGDDWADLAQELGVGETKITPPPLPPLPSEEFVEEMEYASVEADGDEEGETEPEEATGDSEGGDEEPRKRRRRRRRRKKKAAGEPSAVETAEDESEAGPSTAAEEEEDQEELEEEAEPRSGESLEDTSPEAARELIRNWNVPSWDEIVSGLYRPDR